MKYLSLDQVGIILVRESSIETSSRYNAAPAAATTTTHRCPSTGAPPPPTTALPALPVPETPCNLLEKRPTRIATTTPCVKLLVSICLGPRWPLRHPSSGRPSPTPGVAPRAVGSARPPLQPPPQQVLAHRRRPRHHRPSARRHLTIRSDIIS